MQRYFVPADYWHEWEVVITGDNAHHITRVMRFVEADTIICNHPNGQAAICKLSSFEQNLAHATIQEWLNESVELPIEVTIAQGLPKGDKFDFVLQKGTELGAYGFIPFQAERSIVKWDKDKAEKKIKRFSKIVKEASEQSHRNKMPIIKQTMTISEILKESTHYDIKIFAYEEEAKNTYYQSFATILSKLTRKERLLVCIGPEGGFSKKEVNLLKENDFLPVRLGPRILRTETAALYVLASISYHFEELRC